ncbi:hypothetical protein PSN45_003193 [Yamadazyma tenuis]|nr:hypothetical protein PSN45_003193 [Yamadazyma tenuis]
MDHFNRLDEAAKQKYMQQKGAVPEAYVTPVIVGVRTFFAMFKWRYRVCFVLMMGSQMATTLSALPIKKLIEFVSLKAEFPDTKINAGIGYAIGVTLLVFLSAALFNSYFYLTMFTGSQTTAILTKALLNKAFNANSRSRHNYSPAKITSMVGSDCAKIERAISELPRLVTFPAVLAATIAILAVNLGVAVLVAIGMILVLGGVMASFVKLMMKYRLLSLKSTDKRVTLIKEIINSLRVLKYYSWENPYLKAVGAARKEETHYLIMLQTLKNLSLCLALSVVPLASLGCFITVFSIAKGKTTPANIFSSVNVIGSLADIFISVPQSAGAVVDGIVSIRRILGFLSSGDYVQDEHVKFNPDGLPSDTDADQTVIKIESGEFVWEKFPEVKEEQKTDSKKSRKEKKQKKLEMKQQELEKAVKAPEIGYALQNVELNINKGDFIMIVGVVGAGKSSLLQAMAGLMKRTNGNMEVNGQLLLCGTPWVQNATIRDNIVFGQEFDEKRYEQAIYACSLNADLDILPAHDLTEVGEKGVTLSGGQKARLNLARAVYANKDIFLLDDVLSAVDSKVGGSIMEDCFLGMLKTKTKVLATHQLSFLGYADKIVMVHKDGSIDFGTMDELNATSSEFREMLTHRDRDDTSVKEADEEEAEEKEAEEEVLEEEKLGLEVKAIEIQDEWRTDGKLVEDEISKQNSVKLGVYLNLLDLGSGRIPSWVACTFHLMFLALAIFSDFFINVWLSFWTENKFKNRSEGFYIGVYALLSFMSVILLAFVFTIIVRMIIVASRRINVEAIRSILHVPMSFLDATPTGRILNRFTRDTDAIDNDLVDNARLVIYMLAYVIGIFVLNIIYLPWIAIAIPFIMVCCILVGSVYSASSRELKRLESTRRSLVLNNFSESLSGLDVIKAYRSVDRFIDNNDLFLDKTNEASFLVNGVQRWATIQMIGVSVFYVFVITMLCITRTFNISPASSGLVISYLMPIPFMLAMVIRFSAMVENDMTSFERIHEYANELPQEEAYIRNDTAPAPTWPEKGEIVFDNVSMKYREGLPKVLKNVSLRIKPNEKVGICGRTGAGKSTIISTLFRLFPLAEGSINIDGIDISHLGMNNLRSKLSIIPQESLLFEGDIRRNLDPFGESDDDTLWDALRRTGLLEPEEIEKFKGEKDQHKIPKFHLDSVVEIEGSNFSSGEKQLISFARALARGSKILVLDEATSSVDYATDARIQKAIQKEFNFCTILCIAHRLRTIINYDKILVLDKGVAMEYDTPINLFMDRNSIFRQLCDKSKITQADFTH